jgi:hypothetical protein
MSLQKTAEKVGSTKLSPYAKFKMALKSKEVQRQYPNLLGRFLGFCKIDGFTVEDKCLTFYGLALREKKEDLEDLVMKFVISEKDRIDRRDITAHNYSNIVKN